MNTREDREWDAHNDRIEEDQIARHRGYGECTACGAIEVLLNQVTGSRDYSHIGESAFYPTGYGCEVCA